ncbi:hypothetical protein F5887DRAFT_990567 [Amanita rubescens]|nr:hypothetical protein F5887DRAFT_990567 [Amanita rubescens]
MYPQQYTQPPLNSLPPEVLGKIFLYSLELPGKRLKLPHPRTLCSVCSRWRDVGISTPRLWTAVVVTILHGISGERAEEQISYLHTWIGRSGVLPLTLYLRRGKWDPSEHDRTVLFLVALTRHASRWEAVYFDFAAELPGRRHSPEFYIDFPFASQIPWSQLTHFTIEADMSPEVALEILERCPHLVDARIRLDSTLTQAKTSSPLIQNNLRKLDLMTYNLALFFSAITLPSLADLRLILLSPGSEEANHFDDMTDCLEQEKLQFSHRTHYRIHHDHTTASLTEFPAVTDDVLKRLTLRSSKPAPLASGDSLDTIVDMVSSRLCPEEIPGLDAPRIRHLHVEVLFHHQLEQLLSQVGEKSGMNYASDGDGTFFTFIASREAIVGKVGPTYAHGSFFLM